jgi:cytochrome c-type biogenesis protein CcmH
VIWLLGIVAALAAIAGVLLPWWRPAFARRQALRRRTANVTAYRGRLEELEADAQAGVLAAEAVEGTKQELAARLLQDTDVPAPPALAERPAGALLAFVAVGLLVFAAAWYALAETWRTQGFVELAKTNPELARELAVDHQIQKLRKQVARNPADTDSWLWLARSQAGRGRYTEAAEALARVSEAKAHQDPDVLVEWGETIAYTQERNMTGAPAEKFAQALALAPDHTRGLWFAGIASFQSGKPGDAVRHWERLLTQDLPADLRSTLEHSLVMLREKAGIEAPRRAAAPAGRALALRVQVSIAPELAGAAGAQDTLFVFAQDPAGPPLPLAVQRLSAGQLPAQVTLDDSNSMTPERKLSSVQRWRVVARVSKSGSATPQAGDLEGSVEIGKADAGKPVKVIISRRR